MPPGEKMMLDVLCGNPYELRAARQAFYAAYGSAVRGEQVCFASRQY